MAFTEDDLDRVRAALAHGEQSVTFGDGQTVAYRSIKGLLELYDRMLNERARAAGRSPFTYRRLTGGFGQ